MGPGGCSAIYIILLFELLFPRIVCSPLSPVFCQSNIRIPAGIVGCLTKIAAAVTSKLFSTCKMADFIGDMPTILRMALSIGPTVVP